jgi:hypothetical protein
MPFILTIRTRALSQSMIIEVKDTGGSERDPEKPSKLSTATASEDREFGSLLAGRLRFHMEERW